jgi:hypothetical protein
MIAKGNFHSGGVKLAAYLVKAHPGERGELIDMRGFGPISDLRDGFRIEQIRARDGTRATQPFFHVHFRGAHGEGIKLSDTQWREIADRCDKALGMEEQPRAASLHINRQTGDKHLHIGYSLVRENADGDLYVQKLGLYKNKLKRLAREIEREYGLKIVSNERQTSDRARAAGRDEFEESRRLKTDLKAIRSSMLDCFVRSDNGKALKAALAERGLELALGDRRDCFVVIDAAGGQHALNKKLTGLTLNETRARLSDLDRAQLPSVEKTQEMQAARARERQARETEAGKGRGPERTQPAIKPLGKTAGEIRLAWQLTATAEQFAQAIEERGLILVHVTADEAAASQRAEAFAKAIGRQNRALKEGFAIVDARGNVTRIDQRTTGEQWEVIQKRLGGIEREKLLSAAAAKAMMREANRIEWNKHKQAERDAARPPTTLETAINAIHREALDNQRFAEALDKADITITRATAADITVLNTLRRDQELAQIIAQAAGIAAHAGPRLAQVREGELAAVTRRGDVYRLTPQHLDPGLAAQLQQGPLPSVTQARATFEIERLAAATFQQEMIDSQLARRAETTATRVARDSIWDTGQARGQAETAIKHDTHETLDAAYDGMDTGNRLLGSVAKVLSKMLDVLADMIAPAPPPTLDQAERMHRASEEHEAADTARRETEARLAETNEMIRASERAEAERQAEEEHIRQRQREQELGRER